MGVTLAEATERLSHPAYWLVHACGEHRGEWAESLVALAPEITRDIGPITKHQDAILTLADAYAANHRVRVVFLADLTQWLAESGSSWEAWGIDPEQSFSGLLERGWAMHLTVHERAYICATNPETDLAFTIIEPRSITFVSGDRACEFREEVRLHMGERLIADWPGYIERLAREGTLRVAS